MLRNSPHREAVLPRAYATAPSSARNDPANSARFRSAAGAEPLEELGGEVLRALAGLGGRGAERAHAVAGRVAQGVREHQRQGESGEDGYGDDRCERHMRQNTVATAAIRA